MNNLKWFDQYEAFYCDIMFQSLFSYCVPRLNGQLEAEKVLFSLDDEFPSKEVFFKDLYTVSDLSLLISNLGFFKNEEIHYFNNLLDIYCFDILGKNNRFVIVYRLSRDDDTTTYKIASCSREVFPVASAQSIFDNATWAEREAWEMYGVYFVNHNQLQRVLTDYSFKGHPLRKDFPLTGYLEQFFSYHNNLIENVPIEFMQEYRKFEFYNGWEENKNDFSVFLQKEGSLIADAGEAEFLFAYWSDKLSNTTTREESSDESSSSEELSSSEVSSGWDVDFESSYEQSSDAELSGSESEDSEIIFSEHETDIPPSTYTDRSMADSSNSDSDSDSDSDISTSGSSESDSSVDFETTSSEENIEPRHEPEDPKKIEYKSFKVSSVLDGALTREESSDESSSSEELSSSEVSSGWDVDFESSYEQSSDAELSGSESEDSEIIFSEHETDIPPSTYTDRSMADSSNSDSDSDSDSDISTSGSSESDSSVDFETTSSEENIEPRHEPEDPKKIEYKSFKVSSVLDGALTREESSDESSSSEELSSSEVSSGWDVDFESSYEQSSDAELSGSESEDSEIIFSEHETDIPPSTYTDRSMADSSNSDSDSDSDSDISTSGSSESDSSVDFETTSSEENIEPRHEPEDPKEVKYKSFKVSSDLDEGFIREESSDESSSFEELSSSEESSVRDDDSSESIDEPLSHSDEDFSSPFPENSGIIYSNPDIDAMPSIYIDRSMADGVSEWAGSSTLNYKSCFTDADYAWAVVDEYGNKVDYTVDVFGLRTFCGEWLRPGRQVYFRNPYTAFVKCL